MTRLIRRNRIYEQVFYEDERHYTSIVKIELRKVLPDFSILDFSPHILGDHGSRRRPDLAFVHRNYKMWVVVEIELENHSLEHHVLPQVQTFVTGRYDSTHADLLHQKDSTLDLCALKNLIHYIPPKVVVVVNSRTVLKSGWSAIENEHSAHLTYLESFRSEHDDVIVSISGYLPAPVSDRVFRLKKLNMMNSLICVQPETVPASIQNEVQLYVDQRPYTWKVLRAMDSVVFFAPGGFNVSSDRNYEVRRIGENRFQLREL